MSENVIDILHNCPMLARVPDDAFGRLVTMARLCRFERDAVIFRQGDACPGAYIVGSGLVRVFKTAPNGKEHVLHMVGPGQTFAEVAAMGNFEVPANAAAIAPTTCVLLPLDRLQRALHEDHALCLGMMTGMTLWVRHLVNLMEDIVLRDAAGRLARFLLDCEANGRGIVELPTLKRHLANHLNLTSETFSRTFRRLTDAHLIAPEGDNRVTLLDREKLERVAAGRFPRL